jgi:hypothetical protein
MVRAVLGEGTAEMDIIRALHMAGDDLTKVINILLDFDHRPPPPPSPSPSPPPVKPAKTLTESTPPSKAPTQPRPTTEKPKPAPAPTRAGSTGGWWGTPRWLGCPPARADESPPATRSPSPSPPLQPPLPRPRAVQVASPSLPAPPRSCGSPLRTTGR